MVNGSELSPSPGGTMARSQSDMIAAAVACWVLVLLSQSDARAQSAPSPETERPRNGGRALTTDPFPGFSDLPAPLPDLPSAAHEQPKGSVVGVPDATDHAIGYVPDALYCPLRLSDAIRRSLANVQVVRADVSVRSAGVARFDALKQFIPLVALPQFMSGFNQFTPGKDTLINFPDVMGFTQFAGLPNLQHLADSRVSLMLPLDPSGQITALPIADEGVRAKLLMEQLVRRSQAALAIQNYFEAKQVQYGIRVAHVAVDLAEETLGLLERKNRENQAYDVEVSQARINESKARVALANLMKNARISQRELGVVLHQSRLLVPQSPTAIPIDLEPGYLFDLDDPDVVDIRLVPDFPASREEAIQLAKRQRVEVRGLIVGLRIARLQNQRSWVRLVGGGWLPAEVNFKNASGVNHGVTMGGIFGMTYAPPLVDVSIWANIRQAKLDVIQSQLDLERALIDVGNDAGNAWDRWQQTIKEWAQKEAELDLRHQYLERQERLYRQKQAIRLEVLAAQLNLLQADANRWTAWYNLQLARLDVLRSTEQLLDYIEKAGITTLPAEPEAPPPGRWKRFQWWLARNRSGEPPRDEETSHGRQSDEAVLAAGAGRASAGEHDGLGVASAADGKARDPGVTRTGGAAAGRAAVSASASASNRFPTAVNTAGRDGSHTAGPSSPSQGRALPGRTLVERARGAPTRRPLPGRSGQAAGDAADPGRGDDCRRESSP
jgi:hypothetical protein